MLLEGWEVGKLENGLGRRQGWGGGGAWIQTGQRSDGQMSKQTTVDKRSKVLHPPLRMCQAEEDSFDRKRRGDGGGGLRDTTRVMRKPPKSEKTVERGQSFEKSRRIGSIFHTDAGKVQC